jgi:hypothetical protein
MLRIPSFFRLESGDKVEIHEPVPLRALHFHNYRLNNAPTGVTIQKAVCCLGANLFRALGPAVACGPVAGPANAPLLKPTWNRNAGRKSGCGNLSGAKPMPDVHHYRQLSANVRIADQLDITGPEHCPAQRGSRVADNEANDLVTAQQLQGSCWYLFALRSACGRVHRSRMGRNRR